MALRPHLSMGLPLSIRKSATEYSFCLLDSLLFYHAALLGVNGQ